MKYTIGKSGQQKDLLKLILMPSLMTYKRSSLTIFVIQGVPAMIATQTAWLWRIQGVLIAEAVDDNFRYPELEPALFFIALMLDFDWTYQIVSQYIAESVHSPFKKAIRSFYSLLKVEGRM
jgi:hypothetical protein